MVNLGNVRAQYASNRETLESGSSQSFRGKPPRSSNKHRLISRKSSLKTHFWGSMVHHLNFRWNPCNPCVNIATFHNRNKFELKLTFQTPELLGSMWKRGGIIGLIQKCGYSCYTSTKITEKRKYPGVRHVQSLDTSTINGHNPSSDELQHIFAPTSLT